VSAVWANLQRIIRQVYETMAVCLCTRTKPWLPVVISVVRRRLCAEDWWPIVNCQCWQSRQSVNRLTVSVIGCFKSLLSRKAHRALYTHSCICSPGLRQSIRLQLRLPRVLEYSRTTRVVNYSSSILLLEYSKLRTFGYHFHFRSPFLSYLRFL